MCKPPVIKTSNSLVSRESAVSYEINGDELSNSPQKNGAVKISSKWLLLFFIALCHNFASFLRVVLVYGYYAGLKWFEAPSLEYWWQRCMNSFLTTDEMHSHMLQLLWLDIIRPLSALLPIWLSLLVSSRVWLLDRWRTRHPSWRQCLDLKKTSSPLIGFHLLWSSHFVESTERFHFFLYRSLFILFINLLAC